jgi:hypothetical protein
MMNHTVQWNVVYLVLVVLRRFLGGCMFVCVRVRPRFFFFRPIAVKEESTIGTAGYKVFVE